MIHIGIPFGPILGHFLHIVQVLILIPKVLDEFPNRRRRFDLFESHLCIVLHGLGLSKTHGNPILFRHFAHVFGFGVTLAAPLHCFLVAFLDISQPLNGHAFVFGWGGVVGGVSVVGKPGVVRGN